MIVFCDVIFYTFFVLLQSVGIDKSDIPDLAKVSNSANPRYCVIKMPWTVQRVCFCWRDLARTKKFLFRIDFNVKMLYNTGLFITPCPFTPVNYFLTSSRHICVFMKEKFVTVLDFPTNHGQERGKNKRGADISLYTTLDWHQNLIKTY